MKLQYLSTQTEDKRATDKGEQKLNAEHALKTLRPLQK